MSISLNNHESRIKALENGGAGSWSKGSNANGNWVKESKTGLLIQWYSMSTGNVTMPLAFSNNSYNVIATRTTLTGYESAVIIDSQTNQTFRVRYAWPNGILTDSSAKYIAIGYLISDRILKYAYACKSLLFTPLRKLEV